MGNFEGGLAFITGGSSGIGRATAVAFGRGARAAMVARRQVEGEAAASEVRAGGGPAIFIGTDVMAEHEVGSVVETAVGAFGGIDIAFDSAGTSTPPRSPRSRRSSGSVRPRSTRPASSGR